MDVKENVTIGEMPVILWELAASKTQVIFQGDLCSTEYLSWLLKKDIEARNVDIVYRKPNGIMGSGTFFEFIGDTQFALTQAMENNHVLN